MEALHYGFGAPLCGPQSLPCMGSINTPPGRPRQVVSCSGTGQQRQPADNAQVEMQLWPRAGSELHVAVNTLGTLRSGK